MSMNLPYRFLVPNAPRYRRTEGDETQSLLFSLRSMVAPFLLDGAILPGIQTPKLVSSFEGSIDRLLFSFPSWATEDADLVTAYKSVISALRNGTRFIVVHHEGIRPEIEQWFSGAGHLSDKIEYVPLPDYIRLTDWAEDAYVSLMDSADGSKYLMEPWEFKRSGDALIADAVEEYTKDIHAAQAPLIFQGGNCLVGGDFWMLGKDYFADTVQLLQSQRGPVQIPSNVSVNEFTKTLFRKHIDGTRKLIIIGTDKPIPIREFIGSRSGADYFLDIPSEGAGTFHPIFHIDMFVTLVGSGQEGKFNVLVGSPALADKILGTKSPFAMNDVYDGIASSLEDLGFSVVRNPLVHRPVNGQTLTLSRLKQSASQPGYESLLDAVKDLVASGAQDATNVRVRTWHHITWNNCLVENSVSMGKHVYLPTFGHLNADLRVIDDEMKLLWEDIGFTVHLLGDFNKFAERQGVVHCIKKYITRGN